MGGTTPAGRGSGRVESRVLPIPAVAAGALILGVALVLTLLGARSPVPTQSFTPGSGTTAASVVYFNGSRDRRRVALTFDSDSPGGHGLEIMQWLVDHHVPASIFMTGDWTDNTKFGPEILGVVDANSGLFTLGNHSFTHPHFPELTPTAMLDELHRAEGAIARYTSIPMRPYWRPPYGEYDDVVLATAAATGYTRTIMADVGLPDWQPRNYNPPGPTAEELVTRALARTKPGSIIGLHLGGYETYAALPKMVLGLQLRGFEFVTVDQLLR